MKQKIITTTKDNNDFSVKIKPRKRYKANVRVIKKGKHRPKAYFD